MQSRDVHPAIAHIYQEYRRAPSAKLAEYLISFKEPKGLDEGLFIAGVTGFMALANLSVEARIDFFGSPYGGLHYPTELADYWNSQNTNDITALRLQQITAPLWSFNRASALNMLIYKGHQPSVALDQLLQGPSVIDCGMFCQLAVWFGIRAVLGDVEFNTIFGKAPFYLTQLLYQPVVNSAKAYAGNPLHIFFKEIGLNDAKVSRLTIEYIQNHPLYLAKHPGGESMGQNCVVIDKKYTIFDPNGKKHTAVKKSEIEVNLLFEFNLPRDVHDYAAFVSYRQMSEDELKRKHCSTKMTYQDILSSEVLHCNTLLSAEEFNAREILVEKLELNFNFTALSAYVRNQRWQKTRTGSAKYKPLNQADFHVPETFIRQIPHENRHITLKSFQLGSPMQEELFGVAMRFCYDILEENISAGIIVSGRAGIGKTASAVAVAKELMGRGKRVGWISEVTINGWTKSAADIKELLTLKGHIASSLTPDTDVVFLDDDNLTGFGGKVLLEEIYRWYCCFPNKGLYITSNETITFSQCYGLQLDQTYDCPPFPGYQSPQFTNMLVLDDLTAPSLRPTPTFAINECTDAKKLMALATVKSDASLGVIVTREAFDSVRDEIIDKEWIPSIPVATISKICRSLRETNCLGPAHEALTVEQKNYSYQFNITEYKTYDGTSIPSHETFAVQFFEKTAHELIAIELLESRTIHNVANINYNCIAQLLAVLNFAHDQGKKRVIIVNNTRFTGELLLTKLEAGIAQAERERSMARLTQLLFSPTLAEAISYENAIAESHLKNQLKSRFEGVQLQVEQEKNKEFVGITTHQIVQSLAESGFQLGRAFQRCETLFSNDIVTSVTRNVPMMLNHINSFFYRFEVPPLQETRLLRLTQSLANPNNEKRPNR